MKQTVHRTLLLAIVVGLIGTGAAFGESKDSKAKTPEKPKPPVQAKEGKKPEKPKPPAKAEKPKTPAAGKESKPTEPPKAAAKPKPAVHTVKKGPFKIELSLKGLFEARAKAEVLIRPKTWTGLTVLKAVEHGTRVKQGDLLVALETDKIDRAIADLATANRLADLKIKQTEDEMRLMQTVEPLNLASIRRAKRIADEDHKYFNEVAGPLGKRSADFMIKIYTQRVANQEEELRQLEKMYKADDLTEETEEIILQRARNAVEQAKFSLERAKIERDHTLTFDLPRRAESITDSTRRQSLASGASERKMALDKSRAGIELQKMTIERERAEEKLKELRADRAAMIIKAPVDGIVYYGQCVRGKWTGTESDKLQVGGTLTANKVFLTIVKPRPISVRATVPEEQLHYVRPGLKGFVKPTGYPDLRLSAIVHELNAVPSCGNQFEAVVTVAADARAEPVMPGMNCSVELVAYEKKDALTVPDAAVEEDEFDDQKHYVCLVDKKGKRKKQLVTLGKRTEKRAEILKGLAEGDQVLKVYSRDEE